MLKLDVINDMLSAVGEIPLSELDYRHPTVAAGLRLIEEESSTVQLHRGAGLWFNTFKRVSIAPDLDSNIYLPADTLSWEVSPSCSYPWREFLIAREGKLFNVSKNTDVFTEAIELDLILKVEFEDLPVAVQNLISYEAQLQHVVSFDGDATKIQILQTKVARAMLALEAEKLRHTRPNVFNNPRTRSLLARYPKNGIAWRGW